VGCKSRRMALGKIAMCALSSVVPRPRVTRSDALWICDYISYAEMWDENRREWVFPPKAQCSPRDFQHQSVVVSCFCMKGQSSSAKTWPSQVLMRLPWIYSTA
jgi:hypothetical protein